MPHYRFRQHDVTLNPNGEGEVENAQYELAPGSEAFVAVSNESDQGCTLGGLAAGLATVTVTADRILGAGVEQISCVIEVEVYDAATDLGCEFSEPYAPE